MLAFLEFIDVSFIFNKILSEFGLQAEQDSKFTVTIEYEDASSKAKRKLESDGTADYVQGMEITEDTSNMGSPNLFSNMGIMFVIGLLAVLVIPLAIWGFRKIIYKDYKFFKLYMMVK